MSLPTVQSLPAWARPFVPFLAWLPRVNRRTTKDDIMAGLTGALVALPQGVAFATIARMPPEYGLYAGMIPAVIAALFGSSWHLVSGPTTAASIVLFSVVSPHAEPGSAHYVSLALTLTFLVGIIQVTMGLAKLGTLVNFISHSVVTGFTAGTGNVFGLPFRIASGDFFAPTVALPLAASTARVSAEMVTPYPPGIPVLGPGEAVSDEIVAYLQEGARAGLKVHGPEDRTLRTLRVVA